MANPFNNLQEMASGPAALDGWIRVRDCNFSEMVCRQKWSVYQWKGNVDRINSFRNFDYRLKLSIEYFCLGAAISEEFALVFKGGDSSRVLLWGLYITPKWH